MKCATETAQAWILMRSPGSVVMGVADRVAKSQAASRADLTGIREVRTLSSSRFNSVHLVRWAIKGGYAYSAAKYCNAGDTRDGLQAFQDQVCGLVSVLHPSILAIVGLIPPTKTACPIVLTPYSKFGSHSNVLEGVDRSDPTLIWSDTGKLRMVVSFISGFQYLHSQGVVHREMKSLDLIVPWYGWIRICGYLMRVLEEYKWTGVALWRFEKFPCESAKAVGVSGSCVPRARVSRA
jgi:serine/threonine protein kinase